MDGWKNTKMQEKVSQNLILGIQFQCINPKLFGLNILNICFWSYKDYKINVIDSGYGDESHTEAGFQIDANSALTVANQRAGSVHQFEILF